MADLLTGFRTILSGDYPALLWAGLKLTLGVSLCALLVSVLFGTLLGVLRVFRVAVLGPLANAYVEVVRGIPLIVLLSVVYYGLPALGITLGGFPAAVMALGLYSSAYTSEIVRGGLSSVPTGQLEAARSLGLSSVQALRFVVLPQAWRVALPAPGQRIRVADSGQQSGERRDVSRNCSRRANTSPAPPTGSSRCTPCWRWSTSC